MNMSARAYDRILKVARTIADLEGTADVLDHHSRGAHQPTATSTAPPIWAPTYNTENLKYTSDFLFSTSQLHCLSLCVTCRHSAP